MAPPFKGCRKSQPLSCTVRECTFQIAITHPLLRLRPVGRPAELVYAALPYFGVRPWGVSVPLPVREGRLSTTTTNVGQFQLGKSGNYEGLLGIEYVVSTGPNCMDPGLCDDNSDYQVGQPDGYSGAALSWLYAGVNGDADGPNRRAFGTSTFGALPPCCVVAQIFAR